jgi:adenylate cyclase
VRSSLQSILPQQGVLMLINLGGPDGAVNAGIREKIRLSLLKMGSADKSVEVLKNPQKGVWSLFENTLAISWIYAQDDAVAQRAIQHDISLIEQGLLPLLRKHYEADAQDVTWLLQEAPIANGEAARADWRSLFAATLAHKRDAA